MDRRSYEGSFPAIVLDSFVRNGGLNDCDSGSVIILHNDYYWQAPNLYAILFKYNTGKDFTVYDIEHGFPCKDSTDKAKCYLLACPAGNPVVASLSEINFYDGSILRLVKKSETPCNIRRMPE